MKTKSTDMLVSCIHEFYSNYQIMPDRIEIPEYFLNELKADQFCLKSLQLVHPEFFDTEESNDFSGIKTVIDESYKFQHDKGDIKLSSGSPDIASEYFIYSYLIDSNV